MLVKFFGPFGERYGRERTIDAAACETVADVIALLGSEDQDLAEDLRDTRVIIVLGNQTTTRKAALGTEMEIGFLPPFSGG